MRLTALVVTAITLLTLTGCASWYVQADEIATLKARAELLADREAEYATRIQALEANSELEAASALE